MECTSDNSIRRNPGKAVIDLHNDVITVLPPKCFQKYIKNAESAGVKSILISVWTTRMQNPLQQLKRYRQILDTVQTSIKLLLHIEDAWFINDQNFEDIVSCRPYSIGLTWNTSNNFAGGADSNENLTAEGVKIIQMFSANGILIDLAHLNKSSFYQAADILRANGGKLFCTHTCFDEVNPHVRNLDHVQIQTIINSGGLVGLTFVGDFLSASKHTRMLDVYNHIKYFTENFGEDNLAIGTDFFGTRNLPKGLRNYKDFKSFRKFLIKQCLSEATIDKLFYNNAKAFFNSYNSI